MAKVAATYRANEDEYYAVEITCKSRGYSPDEVDDLKRRAVAGVEELLRAVLVTLNVHGKEQAGDR
jgi:hypothetical protein